MANDTAAKLKQIGTATKEFVQETDLNLLQSVEASRLKRAAHFCLLVGKSFWRNRCPLRASALAYTTLLALVPVLAIAVSVATSLLRDQGEKPIRELIDYLVVHAAPALNLQAAQGNAEGINKKEEVGATITSFIANNRSGTLGLTSTIALVFVAIGLLRTIEGSFNDIWGVARGRSWLRGFVQYWAAITLGPLMMILAVGLTTSPHFERTARLIQALGTAGVVILQMLPFVVLSVAFALFYALMPNTKVRWQAALAGGVVGGCLWQVNNLFSVTYVSRVVGYSKIYGSLGVIPIFLVGLYFSWLIVLFGAQVAYAFQNRQSYLQGRLAEGVSQRGREFVALRVMLLLADRFQRGERAPGVNGMAAALDVPTRLVSQILQTLTQARLAVEVADVEPGYAPGRPIEQITTQHILQAMRTGQGIQLPTRDDVQRLVALQSVEAIQEAERAKAESLSLASMLGHSSPPTAKADAG
jgi:membrane protein